MADCLDRTESQNLRGDDFFSLHSKGSKLIGHNALCITALSNAEICSENCDELDVKHSISESPPASESLVGIERRKLILNHSGICSLTDDNPGMNSHPPFRELVKDNIETSEESSVILNDTEVSNGVSSTLIGNEKSITITQDVYSNIDIRLKNNVAKRIISTSIDSIVSAEKNDQNVKSNEEEITFNLQRNVSSSDSSLSDKIVPLTCDSNYPLPQSSRDKSGEVCEKEKLFSNDGDSVLSINSNDETISCEDEAGESQTDENVLISHNPDTIGSELHYEVDIGKSPLQNYDESSSSDLTRDMIEMNDATLEIEIKEESLEGINVIPDSCEEEEISNCKVKEDVLESQQTVPERCDSNSLTSMESLDREEILSESVVEEIQINEDSLEKNIEHVEIETTEVSLDKNDAFTLNAGSPVIVEIVEKEDFEEGINISLQKESLDTATSKEPKQCQNTFGEVNSGLDERNVNPSVEITANENDVKTENLKQIHETNEFLFKEKSNCFASAALTNSDDCKQKKVEVKEKSKNSFDANIAGKLDSLTGTVKIGCLSVTPLNPNVKKPSDKCANKSKGETQLCVVDSLEKNNKLHLDRKNIPDNVSLFLKGNEKLVNNNVEITISPKPSDYNSLDKSALTSKIKGSQPIDTSFISDPHQTEKEFNKNFIVNKNLKVIESFLMQKGFEREANILKEKTDLIKPYLEDIALKLERSIHEKTKGSSCLRSEDSKSDSANHTTNELSKNNVEKELAALTEKFLNSSSQSSKAAKSYDESMGRLRSYMPSSYSSMTEKRSYDPFYGKSSSCFGGGEYYLKKENPYYSSRLNDSQLADHYRSSRYSMRDDCCIPPPYIDMFDPCQLEYDGQVYPTIPISSANTFKSNDFSLFIDSYTAEKYNNFIHFMVPDSEVMCYEMLDSSKIDNDMTYLSMMERSSMLNPYWSNSSTNQYQMYPPSMGPQQTSHMRSMYKPFPPISHPLPVDNSKESCSQLTITPLDESGKPFGPRALPEPCGVPGCTEACSSTISPSAGGLLPLLPPVQMGSFPHQLTITPLQQSSNLPYLHRSSSMRRRGRPPMDPDYDAVGYRKDAYANQRFSRSDFMARVRSNIEPYPDPMVFDPTRIGKPSTEIEHRDSKLPTEVASSSNSAAILQLASKSPASPLTVLPPPLSTSARMLSPVSHPTVSPSVAPLLSLPSTKSSIKQSALPIPVPSVATPSVDSSSSNAKLSSSSSLSKSSVQHPSSVSNGFKKCELPDSSNSNDCKEKESKKFIAIAPKPLPASSLSSSSPQIVKKPPFQIFSRQVKISPPSTLLPSPNNKSSHNETKSNSENVKASLSNTSVLNVNKDSEKTRSEKLLFPSNLGNVLNKNVKLKTIRTLTPMSNKESLLKVDNKVSAGLKIIPSKTSGGMGNSVNVGKNSMIKSNENDHSVSSEVPKSVDSSPLGVNQMSIQNKSNNIEKKTSLTKPKRRKKCLTFQKKRKTNSPTLNKNQAEPAKKVIAKKTINVLTPLKVESTSSDDSNLSKNKMLTMRVLSKEAEPVDSDNVESPDKSDGIRRSGRKRKIIEGNPKFRDMERVDLKYFREERLKSTPVKRKLDAKVSRLELSLKKRIVSDAKSFVRKESRISNVIEEKRIPDSSHNIQKRDDEPNTEEKLQQFLEVNDIYLKPQTFV